MADKSWASGVQMVYGVAIGNALSALAKGQASADKLMALRDETMAIVRAQGDLVAALKDLDAEIERRAKPGTKAAPAVAGERFIAQIDGLELADTVKTEIEQALQQAVMQEIARIDTKGDMVATPLSNAKLLSSLAGFPGGMTMGLIITRPELR